MTNNKKYQEPDIPVATDVVAVPVESHPLSAPAVASLQKAAPIEEPVIRSLMDQGFSRGLAEAMSTNAETFPLRIFVVDNSGSMSVSDGVRLVEGSTKSDMKYVSCTRWNELQETVKYHAEMATLLKAPTVFRLLNNPGKGYGPQVFSIAQRAEIQDDLQVALKVMESSPIAATPLTEHIREIRQEIAFMEPTLKQNGQKVAIILATDGLPSSNTCKQLGLTAEQEFVEALKSLEGLPIWLVIRLCTDDKQVVDFYNTLDAQLEMSLEVLDDLEMEAREISTYNPWLTYSLPLHRCREIGYHHRIFDFLDERPLTKDELKDLFSLLFGEERVRQLPSPHVDWKGFLRGVERIVDSEELQWDPIKKKPKPWISMKKLDKAYCKRGLFGLF